MLLFYYWENNIFWKEFKMEKQKIIEIFVESSKTERIIFRCFFKLTSEARKGDKIAQDFLNFNNVEWKFYGT